MKIKKSNLIKPNPGEKIGSRSALRHTRWRVCSPCRKCHNFNVRTGVVRVKDKRLKAEGVGEKCEIRRLKSEKTVEIAEKWRFYTFLFYSHKGLNAKGLSQE
jgi:hypothetical protein